MGNQTNDLKVGDIVYAYFATSQIGIVTRAVGKNHIGVMEYEVTWGTGKHKGTTSTDMYFNKMETLVVETERKAKNHRKKFNEIKTLINKGQFP